jgi:hypothetical protein
MILLTVAGLSRKISPGDSGCGSGDLLHKFLGRARLALSPSHPMSSINLDFASRRSTTFCSSPISCDPDPKFARSGDRFYSRR